MSTATLVGGVAHGRRVTFDGDPPQLLRVPIPGRWETTEVTSFADVRVRAVPTFLETEEYVRQQAWMAGQLHWVMVAASEHVTLEMVCDAFLEADVSERARDALDEQLARSLVTGWHPWQPAGWMPRGGVQVENPPPLHEDPLGWHRCRGTEQDPHEEVLWEGGPDCWVCGQPGEPAYPPRVKDQEFAPYGWGGRDDS